MTRSAAKRMNGNASAIAGRISPVQAERWRDDFGAFDEAGVRALARKQGLDLTPEINWTFAAEILNRQTAVEWL